MRAMKDSGVDWLGEIPAEWEVSPLWATFRKSKRTGFPDQTLLAVYREHGVVPKSSRDDNNNVESEDLGRYQLVEKGDLVVNKMKAWQGSLSISEHEGIVSPAYFVYRPTSERILPGFAHYLLRSLPYILSYSLISKGVRVGQWDLQPEYFRSTPILIPSLAEQVEMVSHIDHETSQIDLLISKKEQLIEKLLERRQALITQAVTKGLDPNVPMKDSGVEWIGLMPDSWKLAPLWSKIRFSTGWTPPSKDETNFGGGLPWVNISDLGPRTVSSTAKTLSEKGVRESGMVPAKKGSLLFSFKLSIGQVSFAGQDLFTNEAVAVFEGSPDLDLQFAYYMLPLAIPANCSWNIYGAKMLNETRIKQARILLPTVEAQIEIAKYLDRETKQIEQLVEKTRRAIQILGERRQALITQVVTGKLDVRGFAGGNS